MLQSLPKKLALNEGRERPSERAGLAAAGGDTRAPSLSPAGEGENSPNRISRIEPMNAAFAQRRTSILPLPAGEGRGEGVSGLRGSGGGARSGKLVSGRKELAALFPKAPDAVRAPKYRVQMA